MQQIAPPQAQKGQSANYDSFGSDLARNVGSSALHAAIEERVYDNREGHQFDLESVLTTGMGETLGDQMV